MTEIKCVKNMYASGFIRGQRNALAIVKAYQMKHQAEEALARAIHDTARLAGMTEEGFVIGDSHPGFQAERDDDHIVCLCKRCHDGR